MIPAAEVFLRKTESPKALTEAALWAIELRPKTRVCVGFGKLIFPKTAWRRFGPRRVATCVYKKNPTGILKELVESETQTVKGAGEVPL